VKVVPASLDIQSKPYKVDEPLKNHVMRRYNPNGSSGNYNSGITWGVPLQGEGVGLSRRGYISARFSITFSCTNPNDAGGDALAPFPDDQNAPRSYPLNRAIATQTVGVN